MFSIRVLCQFREKIILLNGNNGGKSSKVEPTGFQSSLCQAIYPVKHGKIFNLNCREICNCMIIFLQVFVSEIPTDIGGNDIISLVEQSHTVARKRKSGLSHPWTAAC